MVNERECFYTSKKRNNRRHSLSSVANGETIDETLVVRIPGEFIERERRANHVLDPLATFLIRSRDAEKLELGDGCVNLLPSSQSVSRGRPNVPFPLAPPLGLAADDTVGLFAPPVRLSQKLRNQS